MSWLDLIDPEQIYLYLWVAFVCFVWWWSKQPTRKD